MRKLIIIFSVLFSISATAQWDAMLLASMQQANASPTNLYTLANAANPDSEVNATTGFSIISGDMNLTSTGSGATPTSGSYFLLFERTVSDNATANARCLLEGIENADTGHLTFDVNVIARPSGSGNVIAYIKNSSGTQLATSGLLSTSPGWNTITLDYTASTNNTYFSIEFASNSDIGHAVALDNIHNIKE